MVAESNHAEISGLELPFAYPVVLLLIRAMVDRPVEFDDQGRICAVEIGDIATERMLTAEFESTETPVPERLPQNLLGWRLLHP